MKVEEFKKIIEENKIVIVDFYADWCQPCKLIAPSLDKSCERMGATLVKIDIDNKENIPIAAPFGFKTIPFVVRYENGKVTDSFRGFMGEGYIERFITGEVEENDQQ